jgi:hypothetical protein
MSTDLTVVRPTFRFWRSLSIAVLLLSLVGCNRASRSSSGFVMVRSDPSVSGSSAYPIAINPSHVGSYSPDTNSGAGFFYDDVLEYRVWLNPVRGASPLNGGTDYFVAFAQYEMAESFSKSTRGAEEPTVLVRQYEWINEPEPGRYLRRNDERITEWQVRWLAGGKRTPTAIDDFLKNPKSARD